MLVQRQPKGSLPDAFCFLVNQRVARLSTANEGYQTVSGTCCAYALHQHAAQTDVMGFTLRSEFAQKHMH